MNRSSLINKVYEKTKDQLHEDFNEKDAEAIIKELFNYLGDNLIEGNRIEFRDFAIFNVKDRKSRTVRNPKTGEFLSIGDRKAITFKAGKNLSKEINYNSDQ